MEILINLPNERPRLRAALFDFDGTISTLRRGWEKIMELLMLEMIAGNTLIDEGLTREVREYIDNSTGIQTIFQMQWLAKTVKKYGRNPGAPEDPWWYKEEYNKRLMKPVKERIASILSKEKSPEDFLIKGSVKFLEDLRQSGVDIFVASGTDHADVNNEVKVFGLEQYFKEVAGAPPGRADCSKEAVLRKLVQDYGLSGQEVIVIGDGKVEITLGKEVGAITLGVASDEDRLCGVNPVKRQRLIKAGAHAIVGDFEHSDEIIQWLRL